MRGLRGFDGTIWTLYNHANTGMPGIVVADVAGDVQAMDLSRSQAIKAARRHIPAVSAPLMGPAGHITRQTTHRSPIGR